MSILLTYAINVFRTPRQFYGSVIKHNDDPTEALVRAEHEKGHVSPKRLGMMRRSAAASSNLQECVPVFIAGAMAAWVGGVDPYRQNVYHIIWVVARWAYKDAYLRQAGLLRTALYFISMFVSIALLVEGGNLVTERYSA
ncbi:Membrane-associated eicosanoid/glutathione metabolism (MAPEG) protein [Lasiodiplodia theobromae]|nr:Membrane-associated eicosanoid/glutathione metabolism (MAPEG) protein [Lasiodiplodia theobromae]KAF4544384.1 Membrane-associated eicosanoid/glutathione metabolism (MAPEG) protein [Lasiodiplodia theobromae]